jgi:hypothetical protein
MQTDKGQNELGSGPIIFAWVMMVAGMLLTAMAVAHITVCQSYLEYTIYLGFLVIGLIEAIAGLIGVSLE